MTLTYSELVTSTQAKIDSDVDFQNSLVDLSDDDKQQAVSTKQQELLDAELAAIEEKAAKAEENYKNQKIRAEKAEGEAKKPKTEIVTPKNDLNLKDIRALQDVPDEDVDEVMDYAKFKGITIAEAKTNPVVQTLLRQKADERKTAEATNTGSSRKSNSKLDEVSLLKRADSGKLADDEMKGAAQALLKQVFNGK